jgi:hypothetical protein
MKTPFSKPLLFKTVAIFVLLMLVGTTHAAEHWRLVGITGQKADETPDGQGGFVYPDNTLFEINHYNAAVGKLFRATWIPDSHSIGYCPTNDLVYHTGGSQAYRDDPSRTGHEQGGPDIPGLAFQDNQYMESINLQTRVATGVYNCNPCPNPDTTWPLPCFGLVAPIPSWVLPQYRRSTTDPDHLSSTNRIRGTNEPTAIRGMAWSTNKNLFYITDGEGIFKMTPNGDCTFLARPAFTNADVVGNVDAGKAIAFVTVGGVTKLWVSHKEGGGTNGFIMQVDPETGDNLGELALNYPAGGADPVDEFGGVVGLAQHPATGVIYGIRSISDSDFALHRELVTIDPATGNTTLIGNMNMHIASMVFVPTDPWRLVGITGQKADETPDGQGGFVYPDNTMFEINHYSGLVNKLFRATWTPDSHSIGYCPTNDLVYHTGGSQAYRDDPSRTGHEQGGPDIPGLAFQDNQYMENINLLTQTATGVYNCNPCPNPDTTWPLPCFGLVAPIPSWVLPQYRRSTTDPDHLSSTNRIRGTNEPSAIRGMAWSTNKNLFYITDGEGIFKMTATGDCTFLARPAFTNAEVIGNVDADKAIAFVSVGGVTKLWVGHKEGGVNGYIMQVDPESGENLGELLLNYPPGGADPANEFGGLVGLAQHPVTGVIYGIRSISDSDFALHRELVTIDPATGNTKLVGNMNMHIASMTFVPSKPLQILSVSRSGNDLNITWGGGSPPYQLQTRSSLTGGTWSNVGSPTIQLSTTVTNAISNPQGYFRVSGN